MTGAWCDISAMSLSETIHSHWYLTQILTPSSEQLFKYNRTYDFLQQGSATVNAANHSMCLINFGLFIPFWYNI